MNQPLREWEADGGARFAAFLAGLGQRRGEWEAALRDAIRRHTCHAA